MPTDFLTQPHAGGAVPPAPPRVVVGVDGSGAGWSALAWATTEAARDRRRLEICHVRPEPGPAGFEPATELLRLSDPVLERFVHSARVQLGGQHVHVTMLTGDAGPALVRFAASADLLVVGSSGPLPATARLLGSTILHVAAHAAGPVVVVRGRARGRHGPFAGHVVVGVDGSPAGRAALLFAFRYAEAHAIPVAAVHATSEAPGDYWFDETMLESHFVSQPAALELVAGEVEPIATQYPSVRVKRACYAGRPVAALLAAGTGARLLAVGRNPRHMPAPLRLGSVSQGIVLHGTGPLAVVPAGTERE